MGHSSVHLNGNLFCAIDCETTGLVVGKHELIQLCILPLGPDLKPSREFRHFEMKVRPERYDPTDPESSKVNRSLLQAAMTDGIERWTAVGFLEDWFNSLRLPERKKLVPLGCNYTFDRDFIRDFLGGPVSYEQFFRSDFRDVQLMALMMNDLCDWHSERIPFPKVKLSYLCSCLGVEHINKHDAVGDSLATAEVYRRLMRYKDYWGVTALSGEKAPDPEP